MAGCDNQKDSLNRMISLRDKILAGKGCTFQVEISADYIDEIHTFEMDCQSDTDGNMLFTVTKPESIAGITGRISDNQAGITFDGYMLAFKQLADGQISPVSAPWVFLKALRSGYIRACTDSEEQLQVIIDDTYEADALQLNIWLNQEDFPNTAEIFWQGRRVITLRIHNFSCL